MENENQFSVWPLIVDMLTSILIIFVLFSFFNDLLKPEGIEQQLINIKRQAFMNALDQKFHSELDQKEIAREGKFDYLKITFSDKILFTSGNYALNEKGRGVLNRLAPIIKSNENMKNISRIQVEGHTDDIPLNKEFYPRNNWELSTARAISVVDYLSTQLNVASGLFSANGYGPNIPISNDRNKNRRIEIKIYFSAK